MTRRPPHEKEGDKNMAGQSRRRSMREELIKAGIAEINKNGIAGFSMRRVADACGLSCGAPYKHFENRNEFIAAVIEYVNGQWRELQLDIMARHEGDARRQIVEISVEYVKFLMENPHFRSILTLKDNDFDNVYHRLRGELSSMTQRLVKDYCDSVDMPEEVRFRKIYAVRSFIYGAVIMFDNGELTYDEKALAALRFNIDREFDLP